VRALLSFKNFKSNLLFKATLLILVFVTFNAIRSAWIMTDTLNSYKELKLERASSRIEFEIEKINANIALLEQGVISLAKNASFYYETKDRKLGRELVLGHFKDAPLALAGAFGLSLISLKKIKNISDIFYIRPKMTNF
jgi:hypothetical protein